MLYGEGDFQKALDLSCAMGFDADNQAAKIGGLLGVVLGSGGLPTELLFPPPDEEWTKPLNDFYKNVTRHDMADASLIDLSNRMAMQGEKIILQNGGQQIKENGENFYLINTEATSVSPFDFPVGPRPLIEVEHILNTPCLSSKKGLCSHGRFSTGTCH